MSICLRCSFIWNLISHLPFLLSTPLCDCSIFCLSSTFCEKALMLNYRELANSENWLLLKELSLQGFVHAPCYLEHTLSHTLSPEIQSATPFLIFRTWVGCHLPWGNLHCSYLVSCFVVLVLLFLFTSRGMLWSLTACQPAPDPEFADCWDHSALQLQQSTALEKPVIDKCYLNITFLIQAVLRVGAIKYHMTKWLGTTRGCFLVVRCVLVHSQNLRAHWGKKGRPKLWRDR